MLGAHRGTAEEFFSQCLANATVLDAAARRHASEGDAVSALADAWAADVNTLQAAMWERTLVAARQPQRQYFQAAEAVTAALQEQADAFAAGGVSGRPGEVIAAARAAVEAAFDAPVAAALHERWSDIDYLDPLGVVSADLVERSAAERLGGRSPAAFVAQRRHEASDAMLEAQACRIRNDTAGAIAAAYRGDFLALEAYLVESAGAAGDRGLLTVTSRWELAVHAVTSLPGLPDDFAAAVGTVRAALAASLGEADGRRLLGALPRL